MTNFLQMMNRLGTWLSTGAALVALIFLPEMWRERNSEPEDVWVLSVWAIIMVAFAATTWLSRKQLSAETNSALHRRLIIIMNVAAAALCILGMVLGALSNQPSSVDMYLLILPAALFTLNALALRRRFTEGH